MVFGFKSKKQVKRENATTNEAPSQLANAPTDVVPESESSGKSSNQGLFSRLRRSLSKTNKLLRRDLGLLLRGKIDEAVLEDLEIQLLMADVGVEATQQIIDRLQAETKHNQLSDAPAILDLLQRQMAEILEPSCRPLEISPSHKPFVILVVGVNGVGKTTTIGKLAKKLQNEGKSVMLAAGDTFRAAAVEQLQSWGDRNNLPVIAQGQGADSASVIYDAVQAARARNLDVLIADTAGRLHTQGNLMAELEKVRRVIKKLDGAAPHETLLVVDGGTGQNALNQAQRFHQAIGLTGIVITKLDGTAKGGILFSIAKKLRIPIRFIGIGEGIEDLRIFNAQEFATALLAQDDG
jgi:fused signal recognition particle receptor